MKQKVKSVLNKIMQRLFGHTPFPPKRGNFVGRLRFHRLPVQELQLSCEEFNAISRNIYLSLTIKNSI